MYNCRNNYGGGVALLIRNCHVFTELNIRNCFNSSNDTEVIGLNFCINKTSHNLFSYYNPPNKHINYDLFEYIQKNFANFIIMGDFNAKSEIHGCENSNSNGKILEKILFNLNGMILNTKNTPTFHKYSSNSDMDYHSFIDMFYGSPAYWSKIESYKVLKSKILDSTQTTQFHSAIELKLNLQENSIH